MAVQKLDESNFDETIKNTQGVSMVKFFAPWCGHCRMFGPIVEEAAETYADDASFFEVDVDTNKELARRFELESIPTVGWFVDGEKKEVAIGVISTDEIKAKIDSFKE
jgi:thioredoxin 1